MRRDERAMLLPFAVLALLFVLALVLDGATARAVLTVVATTGAGLWLIRSVMGTERLRSILRRSGGPIG